MKDLYHNTLVTQLQKPGTVNATTTSASLDLQGYNSASVVFAIGTAADTLSGSVYWTLKLRDSDDDVTYTDVDATGMLGADVTIVVDSMSEDETCYTFGYKGGKRYVKAVATPTGTHTSGTPISILGLLSHAATRPVI